MAENDREQERHNTHRKEITVRNEALPARKGMVFVGAPKDINEQLSRRVEEELKMKKEVQKRIETQEKKKETKKIPKTVGELRSYATGLNLGRLFFILSIVFLVGTHALERIGFFGSINVALKSFWPLIFICIGLLFFKVKIRKTKVLGVLSILILFVFSISIIFKGGAANVILSGSEQERSVDLEPFQALVVENVANVSVVHGTTTLMHIVGDSNLVDEVAHTIEDDRLYIGYTHAFWSLFLFEDSLVDIEIMTPYISEITLSGVGTVSIEGIDTEVFTSRLIGEGTIRLSGRTTQEFVVHSGKGEYNAEDLVAKESAVSLSSVGDILVSPIDRLYVTISGEGTVSYKNSPHVIVGDIEQEGRVVSLDEE